jgi:succinyl-CoA synthetase beta subunit
VVEKAADAAAAAEANGGRVVVKAQVKIMTGQGRCVKYRTPDEAARANDILAWDTGPHGPPGPSPRPPHRESTTSPFLVDRANRNYPCI